jgi:hypothetical protein
MHGPKAIRISLLCTALAFALPAFADAELDNLVNDHVMPQFNQQARLFIRNSGAEFVSTAWNGNTRTLIAVAEVERRIPQGTADAGLKNGHVDLLCRHPMVSLITRFLEKYDVKMALIYAEKPGRENRDVVEISLTSSRSCILYRCSD